MISNASILSRPRRAAASRETSLKRDYATLAEEHALRAGSPLAAVGVADPVRFDRLGRIQLAILKAEGLDEGSRLLEFGCNIGRLARHALPYLSQGRYVGLDYARTLINHASDSIGTLLPHTDPTRFEFAVDDGENLAPRGVDFDYACAFNVFTHIEPEDSFRLLRQFASILKPGGRMICSVLPLETELGALVLLSEAELKFDARFDRMRNVVTSQPAMERMAWMAGFCNFRWYVGDVFKVRLDDGTYDGFRQSVLVAQKP
jgi:SAM-dependent methyltransferase